MTQDYADITRERGFNVRPLYAAPRQWVGLTDEEMVEIAHRKCWEYKHSSDPAYSHTYKFNHYTLMDFKYAIEAKLKEKNCG
jgi:hypothetical protein